jgi:folate-binding protein YgfZ
MPVLELDRDVVRAEGRDALEYLNGQISQQVGDMAVGESRWSFVLEPRGKVEAFFRITRTGEDTFLLDTDGGWGETLRDTLVRFKLRMAVELTLLDWRAVRLVDEAEAGSRAEGVEARIAFEWPGCPAVDLFGRELSLPGFDLVAGAEAERWRLEAGIPRMGADIDETTIPNETGLTDLAVSFTKGCYRGQELVERIASRGGQRRLLRRLRAGGDVAAGATVALGDDEVGTVTSAVGELAFAYLKGGIEPGATVAVDGLTAGVEPLLPVA